MTFRNKDAELFARKCLFLLRINLNKGMIPSKDQVLEALSSVQEPDLKKSIVELDLIGDFVFSENMVAFSVKVHNPAMHNRKKMEEACEFAVQRFISKDIIVKADVIALPQDRNPEQRKVLPGVKNIIAVSSGKGGVGKSTVTSNLAVGLAQQGYSVGLIDADIYGPSMPLMFDVMDEKPTTIDVEGKNYIKPIENYGVKMLSIGFFADANQAIVWRGPMASKALRQMFIDTYWGSLDYLLIDLPPGTGDIHLSLVQTVPVTGAVVVTTPQGIALADAKVSSDPDTLVMSVSNTPDARSATSRFVMEFPVPFASMVLFVNVSVVALPTSVSVAAGSVTVTSAVDAAPIKVTPLVPLSVPSKNLI